MYQRFWLRITGLFLIALIAACSKGTEEKAPESASPTAEAAKLMEQAKVQYSQSNFAGMLKLCEEVARITPNDKEVYYCMANSKARLGRHKEAISDFEKFLQFTPNNAEAYYNIGTSYAMLQDFENALKNFQRSVELDKDYAQGHYGLGLTYVKLGKTDMAEQEFTKLQQMNSPLADQLRKHL